MKEESLLIKILKQEPTTFEVKERKDIDLDKAVKNITYIQWKSFWKMIKACFKKD